MDECALLSECPSYINVFMWSINIQHVFDKGEKGCLIIATTLLEYNHHNIEFLIK